MEPLESLEQLGMRADGKMNSSDMTLVFNNVAQCPALSVPAGMHTLEVAYDATLQLKGLLAHAQPV